MNDLIPKLKADYGVDREIYLIGYSLAGLFALWTAYETDIFSAIASCSGSLWFEQWDEYVLHHQIKHESNIYLSLGGKEEKQRIRSWQELEIELEHRNEFCAMILR